jgi:hypothetical protein
MNFCDSEACPSCPREGNVPDCLRHKARFCIGLAEMTSSSGTRAALEKLSRFLIEEAAALEKETAALPRTEQAVDPAERLDAQLDLLRSLLARNASAQTRIAIAADPSA